MKNIFLTLILIALGCKAQTPVVPRYNTSTYIDIEGAYHKDIDNFQDQFVGTWLFDNGTTSLKIVLLKKPMFYDSVAVKHYYEDYLVGEYEYKVNNVIKVSTLSNLAINHSIIYNYNLLSSEQIPNNSYPFCTDCLPNDRRLIMFFHEPTRLRPWAPEAQFIIRVILDPNYGAQIKAQFIGTSSSMGAPSPELQNFTLPYGNYTLTKQP